MKIFHITTAEDWSNAQRVGSYSHPSLSSEGFIHLSSEEQVAATVGRYYENTAGLLLLEVDPDRVAEGTLVWEPSSGGEDFPHLYSELNLDAVTQVHLWDGFNADMTTPSGEASQ